MKTSIKRLKEIINEELSRIQKIDEYRDDDEDLQEEELTCRRPGSRKSAKKLYNEEVE